jgi:PIN domain nuclease of toxin-antitoxin system
MARNKPSVAFLDTHIAVWLYAGLIEKISETAKQTIEANDLLISPMVSLFTAIGLEVSETPLQQIIEKALKISWTRDVFDRLLSAEAMVVGGGFITADENIKFNLKLAIW